MTSAILRMALDPADSIRVDWIVDLQITALREAEPAAVEMAPQFAVLFESKCERRMHSGRQGKGSQCSSA